MIKFKNQVQVVTLNGNNMFCNKKNKNKSHIKREWSAEIGKLNYIIENMEKVLIKIGLQMNWMIYMR